MFTTEGARIRVLCNEIDRLQKLIAQADKRRTAEIQRINEPLKEWVQLGVLDAAAAFDEAKWKALTDEKKKEFFKAVTLIREQLAYLAIPDEPTNPKSDMFHIHASNFCVRILTFLAIAGIVVVLWRIYAHWPQAFPGPAAEQGTVGDPKPRQPTEQDVLLMIFLMGFLGGLTHWAGSLAIFVGNRKLMRSWVVYYLLMPVEGSALALVIYFLLRAGVLSTNSGGSDALGELDLIKIYGFAGLTGLFAKQALEMLRDVFGAIFKRVQAKDPAEKEKSPGSGGSAEPSKTT